jgi:Lhr-like helicase
MLQGGIDGSAENPAGDRDAVAILSEPVRAWFEATFPEGPTPGQVLAWPPIAAGENVLLIAPTGTGKTLAAFLAVLDRLVREREAGTLSPGLRCVYVSPLRSLNYDIERNLAAPLEGIARRLDLDASPIRVGVRTGDTSAYERRKLRDDPPHVLITTPESLSLLLSQDGWKGHWQSVEHIIIDEVHALASTKRGADLAVSLERVAAQARRDPGRVGLSATCRADDSIARFLVGTARSCRVLEAPLPAGTPPSEFAVESLIRPGEAPHRGLSYRRLLRRLRRIIDGHRTTVIFANTRAFAEKITHDLRVARSARSGVPFSVFSVQKPDQPSTTAEPTAPAAGPSTLTTDHCPLTTDERHTHGPVYRISSESHAPALLWPNCHRHRHSRAGGVAQSKGSRRRAKAHRRLAVVAALQTEGQAGHLSVSERSADARRSLRL